MKYQVVITKNGEVVDGITTNSHTEAISFARKYKRLRGYKIQTYMLDND